MNREEILRKSRTEKIDEGKEFIFSSGRKSGAVGMMLVFLFLSIYYLYTENLSHVYPLLAIIFGYLTFESLAIFHYTMKKATLIKVCIGLSLCAFFLVRSMA